ncbi:MAG: EAL domain-containing protein, partial [Acidobacteria bacterium]|nr:EAL domain-containing protein [Acidobacteriota bacterium]
MSTPRPLLVQRSSPPSPVEPPAAPARGSAGKGRLLVVDDVRENREILSRRFERHGFETREAAGGLEALTLLAREAFDLVLLDMVMPDLSGLEVLAHIRATHSSGALPVIMVTAKSQSSDVVEALQCGANDYITKPVDFSIALVRVITQIDRKRAEEKLTHMNDELSRANEALEGRVAARTRDLALSNEQLRREIEQRERSQAMSEHLAHHDALTGLGNRLLFHAQLSEALAHTRHNPKPLAVLFVDLDGFKGINDSLGHATGDSLLREVAGRLRHAVRDEDKIGRLGGDEFAIIQMGGNQPEDAVALATRLIDVIGARYTIDHHSLVIGASIGIAIANGDCQDATQLLKAADLAMYRAKMDGRGRFRVFEPQFDRQAQERRNLEAALRAAVEEDALEIHYQPFVDLQTGRITGFEALSRWTHPQLGKVPPTTFITLAEEIGLIDTIGERLIKRACADAATWPQDVTVAVNVSAAQFKHWGLVSVVEEALAASGLAPDRLEIEVTESVFLQGSDANCRILDRLSDLGVQISLDDFGTGYSSLSYLRSFSFNKIKIDKSFIRDLSENHNSIAIVRAVCGLANSFGASTTAEGVETSEQLARVRLEGCTTMQGFYFSAPMP